MLQTDGMDTAGVVTRVYSYGCWPGGDGDERALIEQMRLGRRYYNALIEIERWRRAETDATLVRLAPGLAAVEAQLAGFNDEIERLIAAIRAARATSRKDAPASTTLKEHFATTKAVRKKAWAERKAIRTQLFGDPIWLKEQKRIAGEVAARRRGAYAAAGESGLYWGTALRVAQAADAACRAPAPPRFKRFDGSGIAAVQIQKGHRPGGMFRIEGEGRHRTVLLRVGSNGVAPVWARLAPVTFHRELPPGAPSWVIVRCLRVGLRREWAAQFVVGTESGVVTPPDVSLPPAAIDIGWRVGEGGRLVATLYDGEKFERLVVPDSILRRFPKADSLRSIRDRNFNEARAHVVEWRKGALDLLPPWWAEATATLHLWHSPARLGVLTAKWRSMRFDGDNHVFEIAEAWRKQDKHLYDWECSNRLKGQRARRDLFRVWTAGLARRFGAVVVEDEVGFTTFGRLPAPEAGGAGKDKHIRVGMKEGAPGELWAWIKSSLPEKGASVYTAPAENTTTDCADCGFRNEVGATLKVVCGGCGRAWDQDENACRNLLSWYSANSAVVEPVGRTARAAKWSKRHRKSGAEAQPDL